MSLTEPQRRALEELDAIATAGNTGQAFWYPSGSGEHRTAEALTKRGLLRRHFQPSAYEITEKGRAAVHTAAGAAPTTPASAEVPTPIKEKEACDAWPP